MKRILIADDHSAIRNGVKQILSSEFSEVEFGEAVNGTHALKKMQEEKWDILILDIEMPGRNGLEVLKQMKDESIKVPVLIFSMHPEEQVALRVFRSGASGYLPKDAASDELINAVQQILSGRKYIPPSFAELLASHIENPADQAPHEALSDREYEILLLIAKGRTISEIAGDLSLGIPTISTYRARILEKMNMKTNAALINYVIRNNLIA